METTIVYCGYIGRMEKKMETTIYNGIIFLPSHDVKYHEGIQRLQHSLSSQAPEVVNRFLHASPEARAKARHEASNRQV